MEEGLPALLTNVHTLFLRWGWRGFGPPRPPVRALLTLAMLPPRSLQHLRALSHDQAILTWGKDDTRGMR